MPRFNTKLPTQAQAAQDCLDVNTTNGNVVDIKTIKRTRTNVQNAALHLYYTQCADALNGIGYYNTVTTIDGQVLELQWDLESFKREIWGRLQIAAYGKKSTTKLLTNEIDPIYDTICKWLGDLGVMVKFPSQFGKYLKAFE